MKKSLSKQQPLRLEEALERVTRLLLPLIRHVLGCNPTSPSEFKAGIDGSCFTPNLGLALSQVEAILLKLTNGCLGLHDRLLGWVFETIEAGEDNEDYSKGTAFCTLHAIGCGEHLERLHSLLSEELIGSLEEE